MIISDTTKNTADIQKDTNPLVIGNIDGLYSGARIVNIMVNGTQTYENFIHDNDIFFERDEITESMNIGIKINIVSAKMVEFSPHE